MGLDYHCHYYGELSGPKPIRSLSDDFLMEQDKMMKEEMKEMEDRLKRHVTECKREIIKELESLLIIKPIISKSTKGVKKDGAS